MIVLPQDEFLGFQYEVFLNGKRVEFCVFADDEEGLAYNYELDENGEPICYEGIINYKLIKQKGNIEIKLMEDFID